MAAAINLDYGKVRLIGSLAFVVGVVVSGNIIGFIGDYSVVWVLTGLLFLYAVMQIGTPYHFATRSAGKV